ncbi:unnamed protein product [Peronospora belbahrii]|uniref:Alpha-L-arabinofuranosidase B catalytic domain-containing protein n=1 Tax=Peronospora belbahrii TaxID=622444 RepID=A0AAU9KWX0_9STRA|nr:unnamed protein product [Peronospora belbahrii]
MLRGLPLLAAFLLKTVSAGPCDIYDLAGTPCVAAHSTVRALLDNYYESLYQVKRVSDHMTLNILPLTPGGIANAASQDEFCKGNPCVISIIYDQSGNGNHLTPAPAGGANKVPDKPAVANRLPVKIGGKKAYGVLIQDGVGYRNNKAINTAKGNEAQDIYVVFSGKHFNEGCCFDYGNAETTSNNDGPGTMEAIYFGNNTQWSRGEGPGPWVMADLEDGLFGCADKKYCPNNPTVEYDYLFAMLKGRSDKTFALKQGNARSKKFETTYDGPRPKGYEIMKKQGAIILGIGGDNSAWGAGKFYEGAMIKGNADDKVDEKIHKSVVSAGYGH